MKPNPFPQLLHAFFHEWLVQQRNVSHHTVLSYRDSWRLFLRFVAAQKTKSVSKLDMGDLTAVEVLAFLKDVEQVRKSSVGTRNCRLAALHSFFKFVADREPLAAAQCAAVLGIPTKKAPVTEVRDLDEDEISAKWDIYLTQVTSTCSMSGEVWSHGRRLPSKYERVGGALQ